MVKFGDEDGGYVLVYCESDSLQLSTGLCLCVGSEESHSS